MNFLIKNRPPVITVAGHIDHGKTTLLTFISNSTNPQKEFGGITQHIRAYYVNTKYGLMTFLDTPGHFAFNSNRENCIKISDIVLLIISIEDGVKPQTVETINIAKKFNIPIVIAFNKIDKIDDFLSLKDKIFSDLSNLGLVPEEWGGDIIVVWISAKCGKGVDFLLEMLKLQSDMLDLNIKNNEVSSGIVLENRLDVTKGFITTLMLKSGVIRRGDFIEIRGNIFKIRGLFDINGKIIDISYPSMPFEAIGLNDQIFIGDSFLTTTSIKKKKENLIISNNSDLYNVNKLLNEMKFSEKKKVSFIVRVDVSGSIKVLENLLYNLSTDNIEINLVKIGLGSFTENDIKLSLVTGSFLLGFNSKIDNKIKLLLLKNNLNVYNFNVIYDLLDFVKNKVNDKELVDKINISGKLEVKKVFKYGKDLIIAGCYVLSGKIKVGSKVRILRDSNVLHEGIVDSLKVHKNDVKEVQSFNECGLSLKGYSKFQIADLIEVID